MPQDPVSESKTQPLESILTSVFNEAKSNSKTWLRKAGPLVSDFIRQTFDEEGARGDNDHWKRLSYFSIQIRKTFPHGGSRSAQLAYWHRHKPLIDTGELYKSFRVEGSSFGESIMNTIVSASGASVGIGWGHDSGRGKTPEGNPVWARPHMFIVAGEDTNQLDDLYEGVWGE